MVSELWTGKLGKRHLFPEISGETAVGLGLAAAWLHQGPGLLQNLQALPQHHPSFDVF